MKIVHLNTHSHGGAAVVARRLHRAALAAGITSTFITKYGLRDGSLPRYRALRDGRLLELVRTSAMHPQVYALGKAVERRLQHRNLVNRPAGLEIFSPLNRGPRFQDCVDGDDPTVVHLHWIAGFVDHAAFFRHNAQRKFVWTLHDMNPITGGCHHADGCAGFVSGCHGCPQLDGTIDRDYSARVLRAKADALNALRDDQLVIVSPSSWLLELSRHSPVTARFRHMQIVNPSLDTRPDEGVTAFKLRHRIPRDKKIVLFVSENLRNPRKGIGLLFDAVRLMHNRGEVHLIGIGRRSDVPPDIPVTFAGRISDEGTLAGFFAASDAVVVPSAMENSPLTIIEGLTCGTPAVAFKVGGVGELISDACGVLVPERSAAALANALDQLLFERTYDREAIKRKAAHHAPAAVLERYRTIYEELAAS
ncbi:MAG TPA: glycosyltransferase [Longimicrobiales bacterium]